MKIDPTTKYQKNLAAHTPGIKNEQVVNYYNEWAENYDQDLDSTVYRGPQIAADLCNIFVRDKESRVIDVGAGTGLCGQFLNKHGFKNVDAMDPSESMLKIAESKSLYKKLINEGIHVNTETSVQTGEYDALVLSGAFGEGHIPCEGVRELARMVRSNGHVILVMRKEYLTYVQDYENKLEPLMEKMVNDFIWQKVTCFEVENYSFDKHGIVYVFKKN